MVTVKSIAYNMKGFLIPAVVFAITGVILLAAGNKGDEVLYINSFSSAAADRFFLFVTDIGLGSVLSVISILLMFYRLRWTLISLTALGIVGIFTFILKKIVFTGHVRPLHYFHYADFPRFLHDAPLIYYQSFPSGHTMAVFAFCAVLSFLTGRVMSGFFLFIAALTIGFSRIYLLQHFGADVLAGSLLGILAAFLSVYITVNWLNIWFKHIPDTGITAIVSRKWRR